jgi:hypothetical protein
MVAKPSDKVQARRAISVSGKTYETLREHCTERGMSISGLIEALVADYFARTKSERPFECTHHKKEPLKKTPKKQITGGGVHEL